MNTLNLTDEYILNEIKKLQIFYVLKRVIRYHQTRDEDKPYDTESVAEHVYGMMVIADYFMPLLDPTNNWDRNKITSMILYHDIDEIETGDTIGWMKTTEHRSIEIEATGRVIELLPESMQTVTTNLLEEYFEQTSAESQFVKAIDKFEPLVHLWNKSGKKTTQIVGATLENHWSIRRDAIGKFPLIMRFTEVMSNQLEKEGFFSEPNRR